MAEGQSFDLYRQTMMGVLEGMMSSGKINEDLAMVICKTFDNSMLEALRNHVTARALIKANLKTYRYCDGVWQFYLQNVSLRLSGASAGSMASLPEVSCEQAKVILVDETVAPKATVAVSVEASAAAAGGDAAGADGAAFEKKQRALLAPVHAMEAKQQEKRIYLFAEGKSAGNKTMKALLGGKGANLCEMSRIGLRVPPGFVISTAACEEFYAHGGQVPEMLMADIREHVAVVERVMGKKFGDEAQTPLLFSVRSGAAVSMPGMMDTVLNLGLTDASLPRLSEAYGARFANDCMRRLLQMFGDVVLGIPHHLFETRLSDMKMARNVHYDVELTAEDLAQLVDEFKEVYRSQGQALPQDPWQQLQMGVHAVFGSWNSPRAIKYREINKITGLRGTAVNIQCMVYGNVNQNSGTGVCFTRNPANGTKELFGEYLANAQGEDVVAGIRTPVPIAEMAKLMPAQHQELVDVTTRLEAHMRDMQDVEFTVQDGTLFMLQCRSGKRTGAAALQVAIDMFSEGLITSDEAVLMVEARHLTQLLHPTFADEASYRSDKKVAATGLAASPGAAVGRLVFSAADAEEWSRKGEAVILVRQETSPEDVGGMHAAQGILTARGGMTSHAAVVARGWGKPCVCGVEALRVDAEKKVASVETGGRTVVVLKEGDWVSINGTTGEVVLGQQPTKPTEISGHLATLMTWVDARRKLGVQANADTPEDALVARKNGAEGIGLCRTEHMFFSTPQRIAAVRRMIAATELQSPQANEALEEIKAFQKEDFEAMFTAMDGLPVTIRLLDPPLHEFLPHDGPALATLCKQLAKELHTSEKIVRGRLEALNEANPMMGLRGCRLGVVHPEISTCQAMAIFEAATAVAQKGGKVFPHIMIPLVGIVDELESQTEVVRQAAFAVSKATGVVVPYKVGSMIEVPRAALLANQLAKTASFFSFGTNDLTQMTFGISRDDAQAHFLTYYQKHGLLATDPFESVDEQGVGELIKLACQRGRSVNPSLSLGVCGEHGGDPQSIDFFYRAGLEYVSCSPLRVPVARLSAAQAAIRASKK